MDVENSTDFALLQIAEPKTRFRAARHQVARLDQPQLLRILVLAFGGLDPLCRLWPMSGQTMRLRFQKLLQAVGLANLPGGLDLGSLRAGGATWMLMTSENAEMTRRRGRWISSKVMEVYIQEAWSVQFMPMLPPVIKKAVFEGAGLFDWVLDFTSRFAAAGVPEKIWFFLLREHAKLESR